MKKANGSLSEKSKAAIYIAAISAVATVAASFSGLFSKKPEHGSEGTPASTKAPPAQSASMTGVAQNGEGNVLIQNLGTIIQSPVAAPVRFPADAKEKVIVHVGIGYSGGAYSNISEFVAGSFYLMSRTGNVTRIERETESKFLGFPALDFKVVNNTDETIFFTDVVFSAIESLPDNRPELKWKSNLNFYGGAYPLRIDNDGWGAAEDVVFTGTADARIARRDVPGFNGPSDGAKAINFTIGTITDTAGSIPLPNLLKTAFGRESPLEGGTFRIIGKLRYAFVDLDGTRKNAELPVDITVVSYNPGAGAAAPPTFSYDARFDIDRKNYEVVCPVSQSLSPKASDRFTTTIWAKQSSLHQFRLSLRYNNNQQIDLGLYRLLYYLPRSEAGALVRPSTRVVGDNPRPKE